MNIKSIIDFKYKDYSNSIFAKIQLVNALTKKEIAKLNEKYKELGLFIKQIEVDINGNEIHPNEFLSKNNLLHKKRRLKKHSMTLQEFYDKYYSYPKNKKSKNKRIKKNNNESSVSDSINQNENENDYASKDEIKQLINNIKETYNDCQNIDIKKCKIDDEGFKELIIKFINKYSKYISDKQYTDLFNKWKNKNWIIKGFNNMDVNSLYNWKIPILKGFKSEIALFATSNILLKQIGENNSDGQEKDENQKDKKINEDDKDDEEDSDDSKSESSGQNNNYYNDKMNSKKYAENDNNENI